MKVKNESEESPPQWNAGEGSLCGMVLVRPEPRCAASDPPSNLLSYLPLRQGDGKAHDFSRGMMRRFAKPAVRNVANERRSSFLFLVVYLSSC